MQTAPQDDRVRVAAEISARYGVQCKPEVVRFVPRGVSNSAAEYRWDGFNLVPIVKRAHGEAIREKINAGWREAARKRRLAKADAAAAPKPKRTQPNNEAHIARLKAAAQVRADEIRALASNGAQVADIAKHMGIAVESARKYCYSQGITPAPTANPISVRAAERKTQVAAFAAAGDKTVAEVATLIGTSLNAAQKYLIRHRIPYKGAWAEKGLGQSCAVQVDPAANAARKLQMARALDDRRAAVVRMRADGMTVKAIAKALGCGTGAVQRDMQAKGLAMPKPPNFVGQPALLGRVAAMRARKMTIREIAAALAVHRSTAYRMIKAVEAA